MPFTQRPIPGRRHGRWLPLLLAGLGGLSPIAAHAAAVPAGCSASGSGVQLLLGSAMLLLSCLWQLAITAVIADLTHMPRLIRWCAPHRRRRSLAVLIGAGLTALGLVGDILIWALLLRGLHLFPDLERSFYYSAMTFTTVGYGDVVLPECWHLLSVGLALNGLLMAGWSTALLVYVVQRTLELRANQHQQN